MWDECYAEPGYAYGTAPNDFLAAVVDRIPDGRVLCLAEGEGRNATFLAQWERQVTAVDASAVGMAKAAALAAERGVKLDTVVADLATYELQPGAWDAIVLIFAHLPPPRCASGSTAPPWPACARGACWCWMPTPAPSSSMAPADRACPSCSSA